MVKVLWDPPPEEMDAAGCRVVAMALPAPRVAPPPDPAALPAPPSTPAALPVPT